MEELVSALVVSGVAFSASTFTGSTGLSDAPFLPNAGTPIILRDLLRWFPSARAIFNFSLLKTKSRSATMTRAGNTERKSQ